jgi:hypothetical protein
MKLVLYNSLGVLALCATICLILPLMMLESRLNEETLAWVIGGTLFLLDVSCRVRLYRIDLVPHDKVLSFLSATGGGQLLCLPIWLWGCGIITATLLQSPRLVVLAIGLALADVVYRLRSASLEAHSPVASLVGGPGLLPPLWLLACLLLVVAIWRSANLENSGWPSATQIGIGVLIAYAALRFVHKRLRRQDQTSETPFKAASPSHHEGRSSSWWLRLLEHFPWRPFALGALIPMLIFYLLSRFDQPLLGATLAGSWGLGVVLMRYWRWRRLDLFAGLAMAMAMIELLVIVITRRPALYLASEAIQSAAHGLLFLGSLALSRSLIQLLAEAMGGTEGISDELRRSPSYRTAWHLLSAVWGGVYLMKAGLLLLAQWGLTLEAFLLTRALSGFPVLVGLFAFSFWFPGWYWRRTAPRATAYRKGA